MKKTILVATLVVATAVNATADKKKQKAKVVEPSAVEQVKLVTPSDSISYAAGMSATQGLLPYLQHQYNMDAAQMADFVRGYREAISKAGDAAFNAYCAGLAIAQQAGKQIVPGMSKALEGTPDSIQTRLFHEGFVAGVTSDSTLFTAEKARNYFETTSKAVTEAKTEAYKKENAEWLKANASKPGVTVLPSGLQYKVLKEGNGPKPLANQTVNVVYEGKLIDGHVFDATAKHGGNKTDAFRCDQVIKGWTEALTMMPVGSKWEIYIPENLAYGERQAGDIKPFSTLIFTVELVSIEADKAPEAKADIAEKKEAKTAKKPVAKAKGKK